MKSFITVEKTSPDFKKYLDGSFSKTQRAVVVESLNLSSNAEAITFEILEGETNQKPVLSEFFSSFLKVYKFIFFLFPIFYICLTYFINDLSFDLTTTFLAILATIFLFIAVNLMSDYWDYMKGLDKIIKCHQSKPLVKGWIQAVRVKQISVTLMIASLILGVPIVIAFPKVLGIIILAMVMIYFGLLRNNISYQEYSLGDLFWGILVGPVLSIGFEMAISGQAHGHYLFFGTVWGILIFFKIQLSHFEYILAGSLAGVKNLINYFGFENGKKFILFSWFLFLASFLIFQLSFLHWLICLPTVGVLVYMTLKSYKGLMDLKSPLGSDLSRVMLSFNQLYILAVSLWVTQTMFLFLIKAVQGNIYK